MAHAFLVAMKTQIVIAACLVLSVDQITSVLLQSVVSTWIVVQTISHVLNAKMIKHVPIQIVVQIMTATLMNTVTIVPVFLDAMKILIVMWI
jgi:hypothetical protein